MNPLLEKYRAALANDEDLILATAGVEDADQVQKAPVLILNRRLLSQMGIPPGEIEGWEGKAAGAFLAAYVSDREVMSDFWHLLGGERVVVGLRMQFGRGASRLTVGASGQVLKDPGGGYYLLCAFRDLTGMDALASELEKERADRQEWDAFLRHELRGKLGPVIGFTELLLLNQNAFPREKVQEFLSSVMDSAHRLNAILDLSREVQAYERGDIPVTLADRNVYDAVRGGIQEARSAAGKEMADHPRRCRVEGHVPGEPPLSVPHDFLKLQRILRDLLVNAWEHTPEEAVIRVEDGEGEVRIAVRNEGTPIPPDRLARIFDRFNSTKSGRMGVGTTVARLLAEAQGGSLCASSSPEEGTIFTIRLPKP
jgi:signal transduction histidine kinase